MIIAIIDDLLTLMGGIKKDMLSKEPNWQIDIYEHGKAFIEQHQQQGLPNLILLDIRMPVMNGYETAIWLHTNLPSVPVLIFTDISNKDAFMYMGKLGVKGALSKNTGVHLLVNAINYVVAGGYYFDTGTQYSLRNNKMYVGNKEVTSGLCVLTEREMEVFKLMCSSLTVDKIAATAKMSVRSYDNIRSSIYKKLELNTREAVIFYGIKVGIIPMQIDE